MRHVDWNNLSPMQRFVSTLYLPAAYMFGWVVDTEDEIRQYKKANLPKLKLTTFTEKPMQFGHTEREDELPDHVKEAKRVRDKTATIAGMSIELQLQSQRMTHLIERLNRLEGLAATQQLEIKQIKEMHAKQLQALLNGGPTG